MSAEIRVNVGDKMNENSEKNAGERRFKKLS